MATTDLVTSKINYTLTEKAQIAEALGLSGNPKWKKIKAQINNVKLATNLVFSSDNNNNTVSWTAPDNSYIPASKSLSISYLIYVNNIYVGETTSTSYNITNYMHSGENSVEIQVRFTMNNDKKSEETITVYATASITGITCSTYHFDNNTNYVKRAGLIYNNNNGFTQDSSSSLSSSNYTRKITLNATTPTLAVSDEDQSSLGFSFEEYGSDESNISINDGYSYHIERDNGTNKCVLTIYDWDNGTYSSITTGIENYSSGKILAKYDGKLIIRTSQYIDSQWVYGYYIINATSGIIVDYYQDTDHTTSSKYAYLSNGIVFDGKLYIISGLSSSKIYQIDLSTKVITEVYDFSVDSIFFNFTANGTQVYLSKLDQTNFLIIGRDSNANIFKVLQFDTITNNYTSVYSDNLSSQWYGWKFWDFSKYVYVLNDSYSLLITKFFMEEV